MIYGLSNATITQIQAVLARNPDIEKAVLYGSRAMGTYKTGSDIDLTLFGNLNLSRLTAIATELDDLLLPYTIDLSLYAALNNAELCAHIDRVGKVFYERGVGI